MKHKAFSLIEIMVVVSIVGLLLGIAVPTFNGIRIQQDFIEETTLIADAISDARANAISSKQCELPDGSKVQSEAWATSLFVNDSNYYLELACQNYSDSVWNSQPSTGHRLTTIEIEETDTDRYVRQLNDGETIENVAVLGFPANTDPQYLTIINGVLNYGGDPAPEIARFTGKTDFYDGYYLTGDDAFSIIFTDLAEEIYVDSSSDADIKDFDTTFYIALFNEELGHDTVTEGGPGDFYAAHNYGICMDTRKGFVKIPCALTLKEGAPN